MLGGLQAAAPQLAQDEAFGTPTSLKSHLGLASCNLLKRYVSSYPYLREVAVILKRFLAIKELNSPYHGGLSAYSAVLLLIAYMNNFSQLL
mgnify:CR=1 FL=1